MNWQALSTIRLKRMTGPRGHVRGAKWASQPVYSTAEAEADRTALASEHAIHGRAAGNVACRLLCNLYY
jgi:hypothetical protein